MVVHTVQKKLAAQIVDCLTRIRQIIIQLLAWSRCHGGIHLRQTCDVEVNEVEIAALGGHQSGQDHKRK